MSAAEEVDLNFKMSKKIAQLTKVIYQLNCRNEDSDSYARGVAERYESEISAIMGDAKDKLGSLRDALQAQRDDDKIQKIVREMNKAHQKEKDEAMKIFDEFREKTLRNEQGLKQTFEDRIVNMTRELTQCKEEFAKTVKELKEGSAASSANGKKELEDAIARKNQEIDQLVKEYNDRYKTMLAEQLDAQDKLEKRLNEEWGKKVEALQAQLSGKTSDLKSLLQAQEAKLALLEKELKEAQTELLNRQRMIQERDTDVVRLKQRVEHFETSNTALSVQVKKFEELSAAQQTKISALETDLKASQASVATLTASLSEAKQAIAKVESQRTALENENNALNQKIAALEAQLADLLDEKKRLGELGSNMGSEVSRLNDLLKLSENNLKEECKKRSAVESELAAMTAARNALEEQISRLKKVHEDECASMKRNFDEKLASLQSSSSSSVDELLRKHRGELDALRAQLEAEKTKAIGLMESKHADALRALSKEHDDTMSKARKASEERLEAEVQARNNQVKELQKIIDDLTAKLSGDASSAQKELETLRKELTALTKTLNDETASRDAKIKTMSEAHDAAQKTLTLKISEATNDMLKEREAKEAALGRAAEVPVLQERIKVLEAKYTQEINTLKAQHAKELQDATLNKDKEGGERLRLELEKLRKELTDKFDKDKLLMTTEHNKATAALQSEMASSASKAASEIAKLKEEIERLRADGSSSSATATAALQSLRDELDQAHRNFESKISKLQEEHRAAIKTLEERLQGTHRSEMDALVKKHEQVVADYEAKLLRLGDDATLAQRDMEENFKNRVASLEKRKDDERERAVKELDDRLQLQLQQERAAAAKELEDLRLAKHVVDRENSALSAEIKVLQSKLQNMMERHEAEVETRKQLAITTERERLELVRGHEEATQKTKSKYEEEMSKQNQTHEDSVAALTSQFEGEKKQLLAKIKQLQKMIADLEYKYANRESRQEDVEKINQLLRETKEKDEALIKAFNDMKFYKLELVNREDNYNKMFGRQPSVANMGAAEGASSAAGASIPMVKPPANPSSAPSKMDPTQMPPNMKRKSVAADK